MRVKLVQPRRTERDGQASSVFRRHSRDRAAINLDRAVPPIYRHGNLGSHSFRYFNPCLEIRIVVPVVDFDGALWTRFGPPCPFQAAKIRPDSDLLEATSYGLNTENLLSQPSRWPT